MACKETKEPKHTEVSVRPALVGNGTTVIITWAKFIGKMNERLFVVSESVKDNKNAKIRLILLNSDMQKSWNLNESQKIKFK